MPITKTVLDIPITTGLSQKFQAELAPSGVALVATNLVKTKRDSLQYRLGFTSLNKSNLAFTYQNTVGLGLGSHLGKLCIFGSGACSTGQTISTISSYSDSALSTSPQHIIPEVLVKPRQYSVSVDNTAYECDCYPYNDYIFITWTATVSTGTNRELFYCIIEASTKNVIVPATLLSAGDTYAIRVFTVGTHVILTYLDVGTGNIIATKWSAAAPLSGFTSSNVMATIFTTGDSYDADVIAGDTLNFALFYQGTRNVLTINSVAVSSLAITSHATVVDAGFLGPLVGAGLYGDTSTNNVAVAYSYEDGSGNIVVASAVAGGWPALSGTVNGANMYVPATQFPKAPLALAVCPLGVIPKGGGGNAYSWGVWFGTPGCNLSGTGFNNDGTVTSAASLPFTYFYSFYNNAGTPAQSAFRPTLGCVPVSRAIFVNNVPYIMVYTPSAYQGSYYLCAADYYATPADTGYYPLRPVGTVAPRQCLSDKPGYINNAVPGGFKIVSTVWTSLGIVPLQVTPQTSVVGATRTLTHLPPVSTLAYSTRAMVVMTTPVGQKQQPTLYEAEFNSRHLYDSDMHGRSMAFSAGVPSLYDGVQSVEMGYCYYPECRPILAKAGSTNFIHGVSTGPTFQAQTDVYNYIVTYEWVDAQGQKHISARSPVITVSGDMYHQAFPGDAFPVTFNLKLYVPSLGLGYRVMPSGAAVTGPQSLDGGGEKVTIGLYRTVVNGSVYYKVSDPESIGDSSALAAGTIQNNTTGTYQVILTDQTNDITTLVTGGQVSAFGVQAQAPLYNDGTDGTDGNLDNFNPPSSSVLCEHKNRIFLADGNLVWYSKALTPTEAPAFNETSMLFSVGDQDPITGFASLDDKLVIFKRKKIYYITGDGPLDNGSQNNFSEPQPIPTEIGCNDPRGICVTPDGAYFMSDAGYRMLDRSMTVQYTGTAVETELQISPYVTSAALHPSSNRLILCANPNDVASPLRGEFLYYDYVLDAWTTGDISIPYGGVQGPYAAGIGLAPRTETPLAYDPVLHFIMADGTVWRENDYAASGAFLDNGNMYNGQLATAWIKPGNSFDGFNRIWSVNPLLIVEDTCDFTTIVKTDYGAFTQSNTVTLTTGSAPVVGAAFPIQTYLQNQRLKSMQVTLIMGKPSTGSFTSGQGCYILGITCDVGSYPAASRVAAGNRQ